MDTLKSTWVAKPTGDMTLSVITEVGEHLLTVDMLKERTMKAETNGEILARTLNDLSLVAMIPNIITNSTMNREVLKQLPYEDAGISPLPWSISYDEVKKAIILYDRNQHRIASRKFPAKMRRESVIEVVEMLRLGIDKLNLISK